MTREDHILAELARLTSQVEELTKSRVAGSHYGWLRHFVNDLETNPRLQYKVHRWGMYYWLVNFFACSVLFFFSPGVWLKWGLYITLIYSIYANFATDYGSMSAAMAAYKDEPENPDDE